MNLLRSLLITGLTCFSSLSIAANQCQTIRFADVGWTDITATTAITSVILEGLGYQTETKLLSVPVTYKSLASGDIDVFLGNWMPTMENDIAPYRKKGTIDILGKNLTGAKYTLAVPRYVYEEGVKSFADIAKYANKFQQRIYGIEPGNDGNRIIQDMIDQNAFKLSEFKVVESSEAGMLSQVKRAVKRKKWIVFLGWEPHPMNTQFDLVYLPGGDQFFGPNLGGAEVYTNVRKNFAQECTNAGQLLNNIQFTLTMENAVMDSILNQGLSPKEASKQWLRNNPKVLTQWLENIKTVDGKPGHNAVTQSLKKS
ncbi:choline ABC transporter substrate-binding protein [Zooshikella marina]|uniref:Choline ABC transporter substrate-binding protein n=1 Tax=Zooshikella ganghwensis TaxID=202772 RepID=A0A4V1INI8_9GAMM|nr:choline ABC transporter substrate-binding protein [Zooshikella ganghwensis]MBU2706765.1 choline ABC transporter substrate-binding protein [Zooshikella ganghwensis]RDH43881.1 choline ABC transporter substrate-binding protein [Zooshikella ganghwensis]